jgi:hypothetical protein
MKLIGKDRYLEKMSEILDTYLDTCSNDIEKFKAIYALEKFYESEFHAYGLEKLKSMLHNEEEINDTTKQSIKNIIEAAEILKKEFQFIIVNSDEDIQYFLNQRKSVGFFKNRFLSNLRKYLNLRIAIHSFSYNHYINIQYHCYRDTINLQIFPEKVGTVEDLPAFKFRIRETCLVREKVQQIFDEMQEECIKFHFEFYESLFENNKLKFGWMKKAILDNYS